ncbi:MAG: hypothetical protein GY769_24445 [bacterium]|nr:hypothetical protein [bacterium]
MRAWISLACSAAVVRRALKFAVVVGAVLIAINHGDAIVGNQLSGGRILQMILTVFVPYAVSTASSVSAMREMTDRGGGPRGG